MGVYHKDAQSASAIHRGRTSSTIRKVIAGEGGFSIEWAGELGYWEPSRCWFTEMSDTRDVKWFVVK